MGLESSVRGVSTRKLRRREVEVEEDIEGGEALVEVSVGGVGKCKESRGGRVWEGKV